MKYAGCIILLLIIAGCSGSEKATIVEDKALTVFSDGEEYPSVASGNYFATNNSGLTTIKDFTDGYDKKIITIIFRDDNTIVESNDSIVLMGELSFATIKGDALTLVKYDDTWEEVNRLLK